MLCAGKWVGVEIQPKKKYHIFSHVESRFLFVWKCPHCVALAGPELAQFVDQLWD